MSEGGAKLCVICGQDCSGEPRIKDKRGRYACKPCAEARRGARVSPSTRRAGARSGTAARAHPRATVEGEEAGLLGLADEAPMLDDLPATPEPAGAPCPGCGMPTKAGAVICLACGFNIETGAEASTRVRERKSPRAMVRPSTGRIAIGTGAALAGGVIGLGLWAAAATSTGDPWYAMSWVLGVLAGVGMCAVVGGMGTRRAGLASAVSAAVVAVPGFVLFAPDATDSFDHGLFAGAPAGWLGDDVDRAVAMGEDEGVLAGGVWLSIAVLSAYAFGRSNPDESEFEDADETGSEASP